MSIEQVRLFEMSIKGERLDEINAAEALERRAAAQARAQAWRRFIGQLGQRCAGWTDGGHRPFRRQVP